MTGKCILSRMTWGMLLLCSMNILYGAENLVKNAGFEDGASQWQGLDETCSVVPGKGRNGSAAMQVVRTSFDLPRVVIKQTLPLETGCRYRIGGWIRCEGALHSNDKDAARPLVGLEYWRNGQYGGWVATWNGESQPQEWTWYETEYIAGEADGASFVLMLLTASAYTIGTWYYDDIVVEKLPGRWSFAMVNPMHGFLRPEGGAATFMSVFGDVDVDQQEVDVALSKEGTAVFRKEGIHGTTQHFKLELPPLPEGEYRLHAVLRRRGDKTALQEKTLPIAVRKEAPKSMKLDGNGALSLRDGRKFVPIGAYAGSLSKQVVDDMVFAGFNSALTYNTIWISPDDRPGGDVTIDVLRETLDYCAQKGLRVVLSLCMFNPLGDKVDEWHGVKGRENVIAFLADSLKEHPALLGWYVADEPQRNAAEWLGTVYGILQEHDPYHPVISVFNTIDIVPELAAVYDIAGFDQYPIMKASSLGNEVMASKTMQRYGVPFWWVGQIMSWGSYKNPDDCRYPTEEEMLAQNLLAFVNGARGIMNYSMANVTVKGEEGLRNMRLGEFRRVNALTSKVAEFVLADGEAADYSVSVESGHLEHRLFSNGKGEHCLVLVSPYEGVTKAVITLPKELAMVRSERFAVKPQENSSLVFTGRDVTCDILWLKSTEK